MVYDAKLVEIIDNSLSTTIKDIHHGTDRCVLCKEIINPLASVVWSTNAGAEEGYKAEYYKHFVVEHPFELSVAKTRCDFDDTV